MKNLKIISTLMLLFICFSSEANNKFFQRKKEQPRNTRAQKELGKRPQVLKRIFSRKKDTDKKSVQYKKKIPLTPVKPDTSSGKYLKVRTWPSSFTSYAMSLSRQKSALMNISSTKLMGTCPYYERLSSHDKSRYWGAFFQALAYAESGYNPYSRPKSGIMQLTCDSNARVGYKCDCKSNDYLRRDPFLSIKCAVNIIAHWVPRGHLFTWHPYFEVLRPGSSRRDKVIRIIKNERPLSCIKR